MQTLTSRKAPTNAIQDQSPRGGSAFDALDPTLVADLPDSAIKQMTADELLRVISSAAGLLPTPCTPEEFQKRDRRCLIRMAFLARQAQRNRRFDRAHDVAGTADVKGAERLVPRR